MTTNVAARTYNVITLRFAYSVIINGEADKKIGEIVNEQAQKGYLIDRILTNENPSDGHNYVWFMIITRRRQ